MQSAEKDNKMNSDEENADAFPPTEKRRIPSASDERRERVQALFKSHGHEGDKLAKRPRDHVITGLLQIAREWSTLKPPSPSIQFTE